MLHSEKDIKELYIDVLRILMNDGKEVTTLEELQNKLKTKKAELREIDFQSKCEGNNSLGNLLLKLAIKNDNQHIDVFFRKNGFTISQQEQVNEEEEKEQSIPEVKENKAENSSADSSNSRDTQFATSCSNKDFLPRNGFKYENGDSRQNFYASLRGVAVGAVVTGLFIAAAVMVPSVAGAVVCGIVAALVVIATGLHVKNSTLPSYKEMRENKVECVNSSRANVVG